MTLDQLRKITHDIVAVAETLGCDVQYISTAGGPPAIHLEIAAFRQALAGRTVSAKNDAYGTRDYWTTIDGVDVRCREYRGPAVVVPEVETVVMPDVGVGAK